MKLYCPSCFGINEQNNEICAHCGSDLHGPDGETFVQKLIWALDHREASSALRAASILGDLGDPEATEPLIEVLLSPENDPYLKAAAAKSLGQIGDHRAAGPITQVMLGGPVPARVAAVEALRELKPDEEAGRALGQALEDESSGVREASRSVLNRHQAE